MVNEHIRESGKNIASILDIVVRKELQQEYKVGLSEMYSIMDYIAAMENDCDYTIHLLKSGLRNGCFAGPLKAQVEGYLTNE